MDGTGQLLSQFADEFPRHLSPEIVSYPPDQTLGYEQLLHLLPRSLAPTFMIAESFSGPLAVMAASRDQSVRALVLVASFLCCPVAIPVRRLVSFIPSRLFGWSMPDWMLRQLFWGNTASQSDLDRFREVSRIVAPEVLAHRLAEILRVDVRQAFSSSKIPVLYLQGTKDQLVPRGAFSVIREQLPSVEVETFDAPHFILQCRPKEAAARITTFLHRLTQ